MNYRNRTTRCPHGIATFIRCEACEGHWKEATKTGSQRVEPKRPGYVRRFLTERDRPRHGESNVGQVPVSYRRFGR